jgi:hypothetical protein
MLLVEKLQSDIQKLPTDLQQEVVDFVEFLLTKVERNAARHEDLDWSHTGLEYVLRRMEAEEGDDASVYTLSDVK